MTQPNDLPHCLKCAKCHSTELAVSTTCLNQDCEIYGYPGEIDYPIDAVMEARHRMNAQIPPLPAPDITSTQVRSGGTRVESITSHSSTQMTAYGLQCAEAAVERERARCLKICRVLAFEEKHRRQNYAAAVVGICAERIDSK